MEYNCQTDKMKKIILCISVLLISGNALNVFADDNSNKEATERIVRSVEEGKGICRDANGNRGSYQTTGYSTTTTTTTNNNVSNSTSNSVSANASVGVSGIKPEAKVGGQVGTASTNTQSQGSSTTTSTTTKVECVPFSK